MTDPRSRTGSGLTVTAIAVVVIVALTVCAYGLFLVALGLTAPTEVTPFGQYSDGPLLTSFGLLTLVLGGVVTLGVLRRSRKIAWSGFLLLALFGLVWVYGLGGWLLVADLLLLVSMPLAFRGR